MDPLAHDPTGHGDRRIDVFLSYAHQNSEVLEAIGLVERLRRSRNRAGQQAQVWLDVQPGDISPGLGFYPDIAAAIAESAAAPAGLLLGVLRQQRLHLGAGEGLPGVHAGQDPADPAAHRGESE